MPEHLGNALLRPADQETVQIYFQYISNAKAYEFQPSACFITSFQNTQQTSAICIANYKQKQNF